MEFQLWDVSMKTGPIKNVICFLDDDNPSNNWPVVVGCKCTSMDDYILEFFISDFEVVSISWSR